VSWGTMAHDHDVYMLLVESALQAGDAPALEKYVLLLEELARRDSHQLYLAIAQRAKGAMHRLNGDLESAEECLQEALAIFQGLGTRWQCGRTCFELGKLSQTRGDETSAGKHFSEALRYFEELGAKPDERRVAQEMTPTS